MDKRFLVVVHAGTSALPRRWLADAASRNWDLAVVGASGSLIVGGDAQDLIVLQRPGPKWQALARLLQDTREAWQSYEYVLLADASVDCPAADLDRLFAAVAALGLQLAQPAFADGASVLAAARHDAAFRLRFTDGIDAAAVVFSRDLLARALPTLASAGNDIDLGLSLPRLLEDPASQCAVVDGVVARREGGLHATAPARQPRTLAGYDSQGRLLRLADADARAPHEEPASAPTAAMTVGTSIAPKGEDRQRRAIASWRRLGFEVVSFNNAEEIAALQARFPEVRFVEVARDGRQRAGKPLVHVDDVFAWFRASGLPAGGFINSDIVLDPPDAGGFLAALQANLDGAMLFSRRIEVDGPDARDGQFYPTGFDVWFWDTRVLQAFDGLQTDYLVGFPHWDYYAVLLPLVRGFAIRQFAFPFAYHQTHRQFYDVVRDGIPFGIRTFELVAEHATATPLQNHLLKPLIKYFLERRPQRMATPEEVAFHYSLLHVLDLWFLDVIDRNSTKIWRCDGSAAEADAGLPFLRPTRVAAAARPAPAAKAPPELSVVIPTFNRADILARCLEHLAAQTLPADRFEVVVIDDGSGDATAEVVAAVRGLHVVLERQPNLGPAAARNRGLRRARGRWVLFLNDDALLDPGALQIHLDEHARRGPRAAVLGAFSMHPEYTATDRPVGWCLDHSDLIFEYHKLVPGRPFPHDFFYTCNISLDREFVLGHGFDEGFVRMGAEDIELGRRLQADGCEIYYRPDCVARHAHRLDSRGLGRMFEFRGRGGVHLFAAQPQMTPHYATMPPSRAEEILDADARLQPQLRQLEQVLARADSMHYTATGAAITLDEKSTGLSFKDLWTWPEHEMRRLLDTLIRRVENHIEIASGEPSPSLEAAAARLYPALQFIKWYHDTLGVCGSAEIGDYLASRQSRAMMAA